MAILNKTGILDGVIIHSEHVTRTIDALTGISTDSVIATGSFTGSFTGDGSGLTGLPTSSTDTNFANTNLTFTGNRSHNTSGSSLEITTDGGAYGQSWQVFQTTVFEAGFGNTWDRYTTSSLTTYVNNRQRITLLPSESVINENGNNVNFRIESDNNENTLFLDSITDRIGILKSSPNSTLDVNGDTIITGSLTIKESFIHNGIATTTGTQSPVISGKSAWAITISGSNTSGLSNGTIGQRLVAYVVATSGFPSMTITPTSPLGYSTIVLTGVGDSVDLYYTSGGWAIVGGHSYSIT